MELSERAKALLLEYPTSALGVMNAAEGDMVAVERELIDAGLIYIPWVGVRWLTKKGRELRHEMDAIDGR